MEEKITTTDKKATTTTKSGATKSTTAKPKTTTVAKDTDELKKLREENKAKQEQFEQMQEQFEQMQKTVQELLNKKTVSTIAEDIHIANTNELKANEYIKIISLVDGTLNLWTETGNKGKVYSFGKFGQEREIQYSEISGILDSNEKFIKQGCFYILDERVINRHGLAEKYESILNKETIEKILESDEKKDLELFKSTSDKQKEIIIRLYIEKVWNLPEDDIDFNKVEFFSKNSGKNVKEMLEEFKTLR